MTKADTISFKPRNGTQSDWESLIDLIYPIGTYYVSKEPTSPANLFGGVWVSIEDRFLYAIKNSSTSLEPGPSTRSGNNEAVVPYHSHTMNQAQYSFSGDFLPNHSHLFTWNGSHSHWMASSSSIDNDWVPITFGGEKFNAQQLTKGTGSSKTVHNYVYCDGTIKHLRKVNSELILISKDTDSATGGLPTGSINLSTAASVNGSGNMSTNLNMPAYQKVYCWCRQS